MSTGVGVSTRTPAKHGALNSILGKTVGVMQYNFPDKHLRLIDCTAGDGSPSTYSDMSSPMIFDKHAQAAGQRGINVSVHMFEKANKQGQALKLKYGQKYDVHAGVDAVSMPQVWGHDDIVFVSNDPNTIADWALPHALKNAPQLTTVFSTLGCNVGGLKRMPKEARAQWYRLMLDQLLMLRNWHDAYLAILDGDATQWAYLVNAPKKWTDATEKAFARAFKDSDYPVRGAWYKRDNKLFSDMADWLFLTRVEFEEKHGRKVLFEKDNFREMLF